MMLRYAVPEGTTHLSVGGQQYDVEHGTIEAPDSQMAALLAHGCKVTSAGPIDLDAPVKLMEMPAQADEGDPNADPRPVRVLGDTPLDEPTEAAGEGDEGEGAEGPGTEADAPVRPRRGRRG